MESCVTCSEAGRDVTKGNHIPKQVSLSGIFGRFPALTPPVHPGFEVGTIMPALLLAAVTHDSLVFGNSLQLLITIDLILHE